MSITIRNDVYVTAQFMRRHAEALAYAERGLTLFPYNAQFLLDKTWVHLYAEADPVSALTALNSVPPNKRNQWSIAWARYTSYVFARNYDSALSAAFDIRKTRFSPTDTASGYYALGQVYRLRGEAEKSQLWLDSARIYIWTSPEKVDTQLS